MEEAALGELGYGVPAADLWLKGQARKNGIGLCVFSYTVEGVPDTDEVNSVEDGERGGADFTLR